MQALKNISGSSTANANGGNANGGSKVKSLLMDGVVKVLDSTDPNYKKGNFAWGFTG
ncbi:hypothetical protein JCGZ_19484 [Jatropha curcas]|uniref:Uncharacterized protein n=1 Tax=Jatropha curcas TaxID=180498 RepID=A0A067JVT1_JATCU|nr:hypothetical protein JCGZ_19484 [Jatropha curcas]